jgi:hypothetical protein
MHDHTPPDPQIGNGIADLGLALLYGHALPDDAPGAWIRAAIRAQQDDEAGAIPEGTDDRDDVDFIAEARAAWLRAPISAEQDGRTS